MPGGFNDGMLGGVSVWSNAVPTFSSAGIGIGCFGSTPVYLTHFIVNGVPTQFLDGETSGDQVRVRVVEDGRHTMVSVRDVTQGWTHRLTGDGAAIDEVGVGMIAFCDVNGCSPVPEFVPTKFDHVSINGAALTGATRSEIRAVDHSVEAKGARLRAGATSFTATYVSTCTPDIATGEC